MGLLIIIGIFLLTKFKLVLLVLSKAKFLTSGLSMFVSIAAYALFWGFPFAVGFVLLLFIHELGHVIQLRREGIKASAPMFIPFLGAVIAAKSLGENAAAEARVGLAGPILGTVGALVPLALWLITGEQFFQALAFVGFFLNLFNLIPIVPLDGGRAMAAVSPKIWLIGFLLIIVLTVVTLSPIMILILLFAGIEGWSRFKNRNSPEGKEYLLVDKKTKIFVLISYFGLMIFLAVMMGVTYLPKSI